MRTIPKLLITGGPCAGKTEALPIVRQRCEESGFHAVILREAATELLAAGITPMNVGLKAFQRAVLEMQLHDEEIYMNAAEQFTEERIILICDRGALDGKAYLGSEAYAELLRRENKTEAELLNRYDAVFFLETAARINENFNMIENNAERLESAQEAIEIDAALQKAWSPHKYFRVIKSRFSFNGKIEELLGEIVGFLNNNVFDGF